MIPSSKLNSSNNHPSHEYINTQNTFKGLAENLKLLASNNKTEEEDGKLPLEDDYFRQNLPGSYGSESVDYGDESSEVSGGEDRGSVYGRETDRCSQGFQELSRNLSIALKQEQILKEREKYENLDQKLR